MIIITFVKEAKAAVAAHYGMLLGIASPWVVKEAKLEVAGKRVDIEVEHDAAQAVRCPQCRRECARHDHAPHRTWRHLDVMQFTTQIRARLPRCACEEHRVVTLVPPWAEQGSRFTLLFEAFAVQVLVASPSLTRAAELLGGLKFQVQQGLEVEGGGGVGERSSMVSQFKLLNINCSRLPWPGGLVS